MTNTSPRQNQSSSKTEMLTHSKTMSRTFFPQPNPPTFPILSLPLEIRNLVYSYALTCFPLRTHRYYHHWFMSNIRATAAGSPKQQLARPSSSPSFNLLLTNRQIYTEASSVLFNQGCFLLPVFVFHNSLMEIFTPSPQGQQQQQAPLSDWAIRDEKWSRSITHLELEFGDYGLYVPRLHPPKAGYTVRETFSPLDAVLARFVHLRTITVTWQTYAYIKPVDFDEDNRYYLYLPRAPQLPKSKRWSLHLLEKLSTFEKSRPAVKISVLRPAGKEEQADGESEGEAAKVVRLGEMVGELRAWRAGA